MPKPASIDEIPLRERKAARTRIALLDALVEELRENPFDEIPVRRLCGTVGISEPTFFKHFPCKEEPLVLFVQLWSVDLAVKTSDAGLSGREVLALVFSETARQIRNSPRVMHEIISYQMRSEAPPTVAPPARAELMMRFPDRPDAWSMQPIPVEQLIKAGLSRAVTNGEIASDTAISEATWTLVSVFFGVPASTRVARTIGSRYQRALATIWVGLGGKEEAQ